MKIYDIVLKELERLAEIVGYEDGFPIYKMRWVRTLSELAGILTERIESEE